MLIAQITDLHLSASNNEMAKANEARFDLVAEVLNNFSVQPDLTLVTGDLVENGTLESYELLFRKLAILPGEVHLGLGNHDRRAPFRKVFGARGFNDGFLQYAIKTPGLIILMLDTLEEGLHGGAFDAQRAAWLSKQLAAADRPVLIALHHPPIPTQIPWMTTKQDDPWVELLEDCIQSSDKVVGVISGHVHRHMHRAWAGTQVMVSAATAAQVALDMAPLDPDSADGRPLITEEPPAISLHHWDGTAITTHRVLAGQYNELAHFNPSMEQAMNEVFLVPKSDA